MNITTVLKWLLFAWKNVWRNGRRSLTTMMIAAIGTASLLIFVGYMLFTFDSLAEMSARSNGHLVLAHPDYFNLDEEKPMELGLAGWQELRSQLQSNKSVREVLPRIQFSGLISNGEKSVIFMGEGVDSEHEFQLLGLLMDVRHGDVLDDITARETGMPQVMLGVDLGKSLHAEVGTVLTLMTTTADGVLNGLDVQVVGLYATGMPELDKRSLKVSLLTSQELLVTEKVSTLSVYLMEMSDTSNMATAVKNSRISVKTWDELAIFYHQVRALYVRIFGLMGGIIVLVVLLSAASTMGMTVLERTREIGVMAAMGASSWQIIANFVLEALIIGLLGALAGVLFAGGLTFYLPFSEIMMPPPPGRNVGYPLILNFSAIAYIGVSLLMITILLLSGLIASRKGVKKPIVEALSHV